jgi:hypothetical protein
MAGHFSKVVCADTLETTKKKNKTGKNFKNFMVIV